MDKRIAELVRHNDDRPDLRTEAVFALTEHGSNRLRGNNSAALPGKPVFEGHEIRQAAIWELARLV